MKIIASLLRRRKEAVENEPDMDAFWLTALVLAIVIRIFA
jgi:hypothetical protein